MILLTSLEWFKTITTQVLLWGVLIPEVHDDDMCDICATKTDKQPERAVCKFVYHGAGGKLVRIQHQFSIIYLQ